MVAVERYLEAIAWRIFPAICGLAVTSGNGDRSALGPAHAARLSHMKHLRQRSAAPSVQAFRGRHGCVMQTEDDLKA
jgi:hypothetical protein